MDINEPALMDIAHDTINSTLRAFIQSSPLFQLLAADRDSPSQYRDLRRTG